MKRLADEPQRRRISVEYDPDSLVDDWNAHPEIDRDATIQAYGLSLSKVLSRHFNALGVEVIPVPGLAPPTHIRVDPEPDSYNVLDQIRAEIQSACELHYDAGDFWQEAGR